MMKPRDDSHSKSAQFFSDKFQVQADVPRRGDQELPRESSRQAPLGPQKQAGGKMQAVREEFPAEVVPAERHHRHQLFVVQSCREYQFMRKKRVHFDLLHACYDLWPELPVLVIYYFYQNWGQFWPKNHYLSHKVHCHMYTIYPPPPPPPGQIQYNFALIIITGSYTCKALFLVWDTT